MQPLRSISRPSLPDRIVNEILGLIEQGYVKPGERLSPERELCKQLGVARSSLREAIHLLTMLGVLDARHGEGTFVREWTWAFCARPLRWGLRLAPRSIDQVVEARRVIEIEVAGLAALRATEEELAGLRNVAESMEKMRDRRLHLINLDLDFHLGLARCAKNEVLRNVLQAFAEVLHEWFREVHSIPGIAELTPEEHRQLADAVASGDPLQARAEMEAHLVRAEKRLKSAKPSVPSRVQD